MYYKTFMAALIAARAQAAEFDAFTSAIFGGGGSGGYHGHSSYRPRSSYSPYGARYESRTNDYSHLEHVNGKRAYVDPWAKSYSPYAYGKPTPKKTASVKKVASPKISVSKRSSST